MRSLLSAAALVLGAPALRGSEPCAFRRNPTMIVFSTQPSKDIMTWHDGSKSQCAGNWVPEKCTMFTPLYHMLLRTLFRRPGRLQ